ncbi:MAG: hypothetical protein HPY61_13975 [Methanotrichaceae archaeon]|nr:hypothetical protein [Methanotrichaceae archaeon]
MKFVLDTNVYIHYKNFLECDWNKFFGEDNLTLIVPQTIIGELDEKKYDARDHIRKKAQYVIAKFREIKKDQSNWEIKTEFTPGIGEEIEWKSVGLNQTNNDDRIIAELLKMKSQENEDICIVTGDFNFELKAENYNIKVFNPPDEWLVKIKDPRDEKLDKLKRTLPKVELYILDEKNESFQKNIQISLKLNDACLLNEEYFEKEISQIKEYVKAKTINQKFGYLTLRDHILLYRERMNDYVCDYKEYLQNLAKFQDWHHSAIKISLVLNNTGNLPADDIDIWIKFPKDLDILEELPEKPIKPREPEPPREYDSTYGIHLGLAPKIDLSSIIGNKEICGPDIEQTQKCILIHYWKKKLKQGLDWRMPLYIKFKSVEKIHPIHIYYSIKIGNLPGELKGRLVVDIL